MSIRNLACLSLMSLSLLVSAANGQSGRRAASPDPVMAALDKNGDGALSADELANATASLTALDRNNDGRVARNELQAGRQAPGNRRQGRAGRAQSPQKPTLPNSGSEKKAMSVLAELDANRRGNMNVPEDDGRLLRLLTESLGAKTVAEIGTSNGYSGIWICLGLRATGGKLITFDIDPRRAKLAKDNFAAAGVDDLVTLVLGDAHETVKKLEGPIDIVFIDADKPGYLDYFNKLAPLVRPGGLILSHNMRQPAPDPDFIEAITTNPAFETLFLNMDQSGIAVSLKKR